MPAETRQASTAIGALLRRERAAKGLSLSALARQAQVSKATLSRWESGASIPDTVTLECVLKTLGVSRADRRWAIAQIDAPRAIRALVEMDARQGPNLVELDIPPVGFGDLLCALRRRQRLSIDALAEQIGATPTAVRQWERSERLPGFETALQLASLLARTALERAHVLARRLPSAPVPDSEEAFRNWFLTLARRAALSRHFDHVAAIVARSVAWQFAQESEVGRSFLASVLSWESGWRIEEGDFDEARRLAKMAIDLPWWIDPFLNDQQVPYVVLSYSEFGRSPNPDYGSLLARTREAFNYPISKTASRLVNIYGARYLAELGRASEFDETMASASGLEWLVAEGYLALGRTEEALRLCDTHPHSAAWAVETHVATLRAAAFLDLGDGAAAQAEVAKIKAGYAEHGHLGPDEIRVLARWMSMEEEGEAGGSAYRLDETSERFFRAILANPDLALPTDTELMLAAGASPIRLREAAAVSPAIA